MALEANFVFFRRDGPATGNATKSISSARLGTRQAGPADSGLFRSRLQTRARSRRSQVRAGPARPGRTKTAIAQKLDRSYSAGLLCSLTAPSPEFQEIGPAHRASDRDSRIRVQTVGALRRNVVTLRGARHVIKNSVADRNTFRADIDEVICWGNKPIIGRRRN